MAVAFLDAAKKSSCCPVFQRLSFFSDHKEIADRYSHASYCVASQVLIARLRDRLVTGKCVWLFSDASLDGTRDFFGEKEVRGGVFSSLLTLP